MNVKVVIGCPGAGKSTYLASIAAKLDPQDTIILSYTRSAAREIAKKAGDKYKSSTIHALCYHDIGLEQSQMFLEDRVDEFCKWLGIESPHRNYENYVPAKHFIEVYNYARTTGMDVYETYFQFDSLDFTFAEYVGWVQSLYAYKESYGLYEFDDLLEKYDPSTTFKNILVDEAQDLSYSTTMALEKLAMKGTTNLLLVGDPTQSIYTYSGADPKFMYHFDGKEEFLDQSYRCPMAVVIKAKSLFPDVHFKPRDEIGEVSTQVFIPDDADMILVRTNFIRYQLRRRGIDPAKIMTMHKAKGKEANHVVVVNATTQKVRQSTELDSLAEKRVFYTAITRAKERLTIIDGKNPHGFI